MCAGLPCKGQQIQLLRNFELPDGTEIMSGAVGVVEQEYLEEREIVVEFQLPEGPLLVKLSGDDDDIELVTDRELATDGP